MARTRGRGSTTTRLASSIAVVALGVIGGLSWALPSGVTSGAISHKPKSFVISTLGNAQLGTILVKGTPLYTLQASKTRCATECLKIWPEVLLPKGMKKATAGNGVKASKLGTVKRAHGALQVTYAGQPLYWFSGDTAGSQVNGNITDLWGKWSVVVTVKLANATAVPGSVGPAPTSPPAGSSPSSRTSPPTTSAPSHTTQPPPTTQPPTTQPPPTTSRRETSRRRRPRRRRARERGVSASEDRRVEPRPV